MPNAHVLYFTINWVSMYNLIFTLYFVSQGKVYKTVVRPAMMYGADTWAVKRAQEKKSDVAEMRMLRWMSGVTKLDRIRNERIRGAT